ncbi:hypothetical protein CISG_02704 [Coccidioides immitis RMSCC 3703]|uniref:Vacuolar protein sorting-associated protein 62 n=1 Tax=Coccidioides immitis RMSCC 3703 TaxID=454286 RepID=A0A0J8R9Z8_COCIT|nr:hypothetical protein CISG_02704 [Coccidioides immitis RMSCC 3703]
MWWKRRWHRRLTRLAFVSMLGSSLIQEAHGAECAATAVKVPDYVLKYAPLVWTHSEDPYQPSDIATHVENTIPQIKYEPVQGVPSPLTLDNLDELNALGEGIRALPPWLQGVRPNKNGKPEGAFGNHVGDWEHNMIRFENGQPQAIWYSQHASGHAFEWNAVDKRGNRPIVFSSNGSHAVYATGGDHDHTIPGVELPIGLLVDKCDEGFLWDPTLSTYIFKYDRTAKQFSTYDGHTPVNWLNFDGQWGDEQLPDDAEGQKTLFGQRKYSSGPNGPKFKELDRKNICPSKVGSCFIRKSLNLKEEEERELKRVRDESEAP